MQNMHLSLNDHGTKNNMDKLNHSEVDKVQISKYFGMRPSFKQLFLKIMAESAALFL